MFSARGGEYFDEICQDFTTLYVEKDQKKVLQTRRSTKLNFILLRGSDGFGKGHGIGQSTGKKSCYKI